MASKPPANDPAHLDAMAKQLGFPDYATWAAWNAKRSQGSRSVDPSKVTVTGSASTMPAKKSGNWLSQLFSRYMPQSSGIMLASDALGRANQQAGLQ